VEKDKKMKVQFAKGLLALLLTLVTMGSAQELIKATDNIYLFGEEAFSLVILTDDGVVVVDPINDAQSQKLDVAIKELSDQPVRYVFYSHNHWDHISGAQIFKDQGAIIVSHIDTANNLKPNASVPTPDLTWAGSQSSITVGNKTIELHHFGPSHGEGMTVFTIPEESVMYTVDLVVAKRVGFMNLPDFDVAGWIATLDEMLELDYDIALFAHIPHLPNMTNAEALIGTKDSVAIQKQFLVDLTTAVQEALQRGDFMAAMSVQLPQYEDWAFYNEWLPLNAMTVTLQSFMGY